MFSTPIQSRHKAGVFLVVISAIVFSFAGIITKAVPNSAWDIIFWRGVAAASFTLTYLGLRGALFSEIRGFGKPAWAVCGLMAAGTAAFIPAFKLSSVANVALVYAAAPFVAAGLAFLLIGERPARRTLIASMTAFAGVALLMLGSFTATAFAGDLLALCMTVMMAGTMVIYRMYPETTAALPAAVSSLCLLPLAMVWGDPLAVPTAELPGLILFGLVFAIASVTLSEGARRLPAPETALLSTLEMPLAPLLALILLSEVPGVFTVIGGLIIFASVIWSQRRAV